MRALRAIGFGAILGIAVVAGTIQAAGPGECTRDGIGSGMMWYASGFSYCHGIFHGDEGYTCVGEHYGPSDSTDCWGVSFYTPT